MSNLDSDVKKAAQTVAADVTKSAEHAEARAEGTLAHNWKWVALAGALAVLALALVVVW